ncbi:MAG TPA: DNA replication and repair protein RecF [Woeseiaceae bacterium]|nr:DNA replication and repair protein RecF [Woeseiaceae bacterium]
MTLRSFSCTDFRCLASVQLEFDERFNLVYGANASGKTSLLEAIAYLGRGKSFRGAPTERLVRHGASEFLLRGSVRSGVRDTSIGVRNGRSGLEISIGGDRSGGVAALASALPLQVMDPDVHSLVAGGPEHRRRYLDWLTFHVEHGYLDLWRRFRRALKQRNAALREGLTRELSSWDAEFVQLALSVDASRRRALDKALPVLETVGLRLLGSEVGFEYIQGWVSGRTLAEALAAGVDRDLAAGSSSAGPHRADLRLIYDDRQARKLVSRGQQKLLASAMILAASRVVQLRLEHPLLLLLDDPAAELDQRSLERLMEEVTDLGAQVIATALTLDPGWFPAPPATFHVEQGVLSLG